MPDLMLWVIYQHPKDYPDGYVVRRWKIGDGRVIPDPAFSRADSLGDARMRVPDGLVRLPPQPGDDPVIAETWI